MSDNVSTIPGQQGAISNDKIKHVARTIEQNKANAKLYQEDMSEEVKAFGEQGGNKKAIKDAQKLAEMDAQQAQDYLRSLDHYCHVLGVWDQADMINHAAE